MQLPYQLHNRPVLGCLWFGRVPPPSSGAATRVYFRRRRDSLRSRSARPHLVAPPIVELHRAGGRNLWALGFGRIAECQGPSGGVLCASDNRPTLASPPISGRESDVRLAECLGPDELEIWRRRQDPSPYPQAGRGSERMAGRGELLIRQPPRPRRRRRGRGEVFVLGPQVPIWQTEGGGVWVGGAAVHAPSRAPCFGHASIPRDPPHGAGRARASGALRWAPDVNCRRDAPPQL
jgi:hypothetical protein